VAKEKHQGWVANLNNGETVFEGQYVPGERTPWGKLRQRCELEGLWITQIQLQIDGKTWVGIGKADGYCWFRDVRIGGLVGGNYSEKHHAGIGSVVGDTVYCTVIDANGQSQQSARPLASMRLHCVLRPASEPEIGLDEFKEANLRLEAERRLGKHD
jgi:hypothetical protein